MGAGLRSVGRPPAGALVGLLYALLAGTLLFAAAELLSSDTTGPWLDLAGAAVFGLAMVSAVVFFRTALLRRRERLHRRAWGWTAAAAAGGLVGLGAILFLATILQVEPILSGADVTATRPVLHALPVPPRATLVSEHPGPAGTQSILAEYRVPDLSQVAAFYRRALPEAGWTSLDTTPSDSYLRYQKGEFLVVAVIDLAPGNTDYALTVDRVPPLPSPSPSAG